MKIRWRYSIAFPLILSLALGGLSAWLDRISEVQIEEVVLNPDEPQYWMSGITGNRFDEQGRLKEKLTAQKAWQLPQSNDVHFSTPQLALYRDGRLLYQVQSAQSIYNIYTRQVVFQQGVILTKAAENQRPAGVFKTNSLSIDTRTEFARTDEPVTFEYGKSHGSAQGMTYDHQKGLLNFPAKVKATIYDVQNI